MRIKSLSFILILFVFIACNPNDEFDILDNKIIKENIDYKQFTIVLETNNYNYIKQVLENYNININEVKNGETVLNKYKYFLNKNILELLRNHKAKNCRELKNYKCKKLDIFNKFKTFVTTNKKYRYEKSIQKQINKFKSISDIIEYLILTRRYELLKFTVQNIENINDIKLKKFSIDRNIDGSIKVGIPIKKYDEVLILDYAMNTSDNNIIELLSKHGAKQACEILKTECKDIKIENTKGDK